MFVQPPSAEAGEAMKKRLRSDLQRAMKDRRAAQIELLRALIAAIDNAEAVTPPSLPALSTPYQFRDRTSEAARRILNEAEIKALLMQERESRLLAAETYARLHADAEAEKLRVQAALIGRYIDAPPER